MKVDLDALRFPIMMAVFGLAYAARMMKGVARDTPEGLSFGMKPLIMWAGLLVLLVLPVYFALSVYPMWMRHHSIPVWLLVVLIAGCTFVLFQLPGTIVLTPTAIVQRFWLRPSKSIQYTEVMAIEPLQGGRMIRVLGDNRVSITHTWNHCASKQFLDEITRRRADSKVLNSR
jgi:hypothetical protein